MLSIKVKQELSEKIQDLLRHLDDEELPLGEVNFILHVDGAESWSWANIVNTKRVKSALIPDVLIQNLSVYKDV